MKIQYCSDLHVEFPENREFLNKHPLKAGAGLLLLAGDILPFSLYAKETGFIDFVGDHFEQVYWIPGNHEYYHSDIMNIPDPLLEKLRSNVWIVNNNTVEYKNITLICSSLWSRISPLNAWTIQNGFADFFNIRCGGKKLTTDMYNELHERCLSFLQLSIDKNRDSKKIVITHHVPTLFHYPREYLHSPLTEAFSTELYDLVYASGVDHWIYGHHHYNNPAFAIGRTAMHTNQLGYVQLNEQKGFNLSACIDI